MFGGVQRRLVLSYAMVIAVTLLLLGPVLYVRFSGQLAQAEDVALRLATQRQAGLALVPAGIALGINPHFQAPPSLAERDTFYLLLTPDGDVTSNPMGVHHAGLPDQSAAQQAARHGYGVFSTLSTADAGDVRLYTAVIKRHGVVIALVQGGRPLKALVSARRDLLYLLLALGGAAVAICSVGGLVLTREAMRPINAAFAAQRAFVADASHELRTPLTLIRTNAEVLLEAEAVSDPDDRALVDDIVREAGHMGRLIADLLILARLDAGALSMEWESVALDAVVVSACRQMTRLAERHDVRLHGGPVVPLVVRGDRGRLEQVLLILLDNAVKYNRAGGSVEVRLGCSDQRAVLEVSDDGSGIPASELPRLFARFHRGRGAGMAADGSGLGLAIAAGIAQAHHGRLFVDSREGAGTRFSLSLPLAGRQ